VENNNPYKEKVAFIINPKSGTRNKKELPDMIMNTMNSLKYEVEIAYTKCAGHAPELVNEFVEKGYSRIVAVGGDGTVNEVARALANKPSALGIIPCGSGNGLARFLNIPLKAKEAIQLINNGGETSIDYGLINDHPFFCTCGVGFDAHIGNKFATAKRRGFYTYIKETISSFFHYKPKKYKIKVDGEKIKTRAFLITVANAGQYGNDAYIAPKADVRDGKLDLCILSPFPKHKAFGLGLKLFNKTIDRSQYVQTIKGESITIKRKKKGEVHLDGEPAIMGKKLKIEIVKQGLRVIMP
jgi:YegS/Rv2252/BmrU family lipid kinase